MPRPAVWNGDPPCDHEVASAHQTHYCSYIRAPRLLTLQQPEAPDELLLITAHQWYELWFKVLLTDLRALLRPAPSGPADEPTFEPVKLLRRGIELFKLFDQHADLAETVLMREMGLTRALRARAVSDQFAMITRLARRLKRLERQPLPGLVEAAREYSARAAAFARRYRVFINATLLPDDPGGPTYAEWLRLPELLDLQQGVKSAWCEKGESPACFWRPEQISPDENMFITVHQCFEVWFQAILALVDRAIPALLAGDIPHANRLMRRVVLIQRLLVPQIQIPATMLPLDFMRFRDQKMERDGRQLHTGLSPASGTESYLFREIEIVAGLRDDEVFQRFLAGTDSLPIRLLTARQRKRLQQTTLPEAFEQAVRRRGLARLDDLFAPANRPNPHVDLAELADTLLDFDEFFRLWRVGHVMMVEKMIGARSGTGFLGPEYLMETAGIKIQERNRVFADRQVRPRFFEALWEVRSRLSS